MEITVKNLRIFGLIWSAIFAGIAYFAYHNLANWAVDVALVFLALSLIIPKTLTPFYKIWVKFGNVVGHINSKIIIALLFFGLFLPTSLVLKLFRKDLLSKKICSKTKSYFVEREQQPGSMENQF